MTRARSLTEWLVAHGHRPVTAADRRRAALHWLDWIGCVAAARRSDAAQALLRYRPLPLESSPWSAAWPSLLGPVASDMQAVWLEAGLATIEEMDDMHREGILHPGPVVLPVLAHCARHAGVGRRRLFDALVRGYETTIRIGMSLGPGHYERCHNTATAGVFGAAAAAADALQLGDAERVWALGNAGTQAAGWWQVRLEPVMSKALHTGHAAWAGLNAALLARAGFDGPRFILEGEKGFYAALCPDPLPAAVTASGAPQPWLIHRTSFKPWPACRHAHAAIDAMLAIRSSAGDVALPFVRARVDTYRDALDFCATVHPDSRKAAKFSLPHCIAVAALHGPLQPADFDAPRYGDPAVRALAARVELAVAEPFASAYPGHYGARVTVTDGAGRDWSASVPDAWGDPDHPLDEAAVLRKLAALLAYGEVPPARSNAIRQAAARLLAEEDSAIDDAPLPAALLDALWPAPAAAVLPCSPRPAPDPGTCPASIDPPATA